MSQWNYFVTAQSATVVTHAVGPICFTSPEPADLVVARATRLEVLRLDPHGGSPSLLCKLPLHGRVASLQALRPASSTQDLLLLLTEKRQLVSLRFEGSGATGQLAAAAVGSLHDSICRTPVDHAPFCACEPSGRAAAVYIYEGRLQVLGLGAVRSAEPIDLQAFTTHEVRPRVLHLAFLHTDDKPLLATLQADCEDARSLCLWDVELDARELRGRGAAMATRAGAGHLAPVPQDGVLVLGGGRVTYHDNKGRRATSSLGGPREVAATALRSDATGPRWLVSGQDGTLWVVRLLPAMANGSRSSSSSSSAAAEPEPPTLALQQLGVASPPRALAWLADNYVFVGSAIGDSQFLRLSAAPDSSGNCFTVEETWPNLGPIVDFCLTDIDDDGQNQVVTCSGAGHTGSLRLMRIGVGVNEAGSLEGFAGVLGLWSLPSVGGGALALSFVGSTRILGLTPGGTELEERVAPGFACDEEALLCCEAEGVALQVTRTGVRAAAPEDLATVAQWSCSQGPRIQVAAAARSGVILAFGSAAGEVALLHCWRPAAGSSLALEVAARWHLGGEVACVCARGDLCVAGLWTRELLVFTLSSPDVPPQRPADALPGGSLPRALALARVAGGLRLLVGLGDGVLASCSVEEATLALGRWQAVRLGTQPMRLLPFADVHGSGEEHVFAAGDRPAIVHGCSRCPGQLAHASVSLRRVSHAACFSTPPFAGCLALVAEQRLTVCSFEDIQRVHVRTVPLGETPHRISHQKQSGVFAVACHPLNEDSTLTGGSALGPHTSLRFIGERSLETLQMVQLAAPEMVSALCSATLDGDAVEYLAVGTAFASPEELEPQRGRILLYAQAEGSRASSSTSRAESSPTSFAMVSEIEVPGAVYSLLPFQGMLLGSVNNRVMIWRRSAEDARRLEEVCSYGGFMIAVQLQSHGEFVLVGDLMRSASLLRYCAKSCVLEEVAHDSASAWLTAVEMLSEDVYLCADDSHNLFALARNVATPARSRSGTRSKGSAEDPSAELERVGQLHTGEFVNRIRRGALVEPLVTVMGGGSDTWGPRLMEQAVWASVDGAVGLVASLSSERDFEQLWLLQEAVAKEAPVVSGLPHGAWRDTWAEATGPQPHRGFVDGDLVESLLELPLERQQAVAASLEAQGVVVGGVEGLVREVEQLARLH